MASRRETKEQQKEVEQALRGLLYGGALKAGAMLPSVSELAQEHGVSRYIAHRALGAVEQEGLFHAVPKVGSFAGTQTGGSSAQTTCSYAIVADENDPHPYRSEIQVGFDSRVACHGGAALEMLASTVSRHRLPIEGTFLLAGEARIDPAAPLGTLNWGVPCVRTGSHWRQGEVLDLVSFDDEDGGFRAARHLIERGFKSIAFFGLHAPTLPMGGKEWSRGREDGWRRALHQAGLPWHGMSFHPDVEADDSEGARRIGRSLAGALLARGDVRGVVAANDALALGILDVLREMQVPRSEWPAIVAFDNSEEARRLNITSFRLTWEGLGQEAADLLWRRVRGELPPQPQHRAIPMRLIPRLSCREKWPSLAL